MNKNVLQQTIPIELRDQSFSCQKWSLLIAALIALLGSVSMIFMMGFITQLMMNMMDKDLISKQLDEEQKEELRAMIKSTLIASSIISIFLNLIGVFGALKEHYYLSISYGIIMAFNTIVLLFSSLQHSWLCIHVIFSITITILAFKFAMTIRRFTNYSNHLV